MCLQNADVNACMDLGRERTRARDVATRQTGPVGACCVSTHDEVEA
jgi:hypothetical protein